MIRARKTLEKYLEFFPQDRKNLLLLETQLLERENLFDRKNFKGHIVANALVVNGNKVLTIFHNFLKMHIQPGGHFELGDNDVVSAALRELKEETSIGSVRLHPWHQKTAIPILIESHLIPQNKSKKEKEHHHHDFMYIFETEEDKISLQLKEVSGFKWEDIDFVISEQNSFMAKALRRMQNLKII